MSSEIDAEHWPMLFAQARSHAGLAKINGQLVKVLSLAILHVQWGNSDADLPVLIRRIEDMRMHAAQDIAE